MPLVHLIVNPRSGYGGQAHLLTDLRTLLRQAGRAVVEHITTGPADATVYARTIPDNVEAVMVLGGDGTVSEVVNAMAGRPVPILPCPAGTENLLAKELRIPAHPQRLVELLQQRNIVRCDVGRVNGRNFLLIIGVGFDGEVVRRLSKTRTGHISHLSYFWPIWRTFWEHDFPRLRVIADGEEVFDGLGLAFVGNISRYAVGLRICRDAEYNDGLLDVVVFGCRAQHSLMLHAAWTLLRRHPLKGDVVYRQARKLRIESEPNCLSQIDGDPGPNTPLDIEVLPEQVKLIVPRKEEHHLFWPWRNNA